MSSLFNFTQISKYATTKIRS